MLNNMWKDFFDSHHSYFGHNFESMFTREIERQFSNKERSLPFFSASNYCLLLETWHFSFNKSFIYTFQKAITYYWPRSHRAALLHKSVMYESFDRPASKFRKKMFFCLLSVLPQITISLGLFVILSTLFSSPWLYHWNVLKTSLKSFHLFFFISTSVCHQLLKHHVGKTWIAGSSPSR